MSQIQPYEVAVLLQIYNERIIGKAGYTSIQKVRSKIKWIKIASVYGVRDSFDSVARRLIKRRFLSDDGKSLEVLYLDKLGVDYIIGYLEKYPNAQRDLEEVLNRK